MDAVLSDAVDVIDAINTNGFTNCAYLYDGSFEGILSAVFAAYERHEHPCEIVAHRDFQPRFGEVSVDIETDYEKAVRVRRGVERVCGRDASLALARAAASDMKERGSVVYRFIRFAMARPASQRAHAVLDDLANPIVADVIRLATRTSNECEKMRQFIRFSHLENGVWYAKCNPNASVVPFIMGYFAARLNDQAFMIYDETHDIAGVYDGREWSLVSGRVVQAAPATENDELMQAAWKRFYDALSIDARYNPELRRHFLPVRLWSNVCELSPRRETSGK